MSKQDEGSSDHPHAVAGLAGRATDVDRRGFLGSAGLLAMGAAIPLITADSTSPALAQGQPPSSGSGATAAKPAAGPQMLDFPGKNKELVVLGDRPLVAETPERLLDDDTTPTSKFFIRNNGQLPEATKEPDAWKITVDGEVNNPLTITLGELKSRFPAVTRRMVMECGGNGRSFYTPQARGNQWTNGGIGCAEWTGVRLADVLKAAGVKPSALFTGHYGADPHLSGEPNRVAISRGVPMTKAMDENNLIVWAMNGEPLSLVHGFPIRLIIAGWPGSVSSKWLTRVWVRDKIHDGAGMGGTSYRVPIKPIVPGSNDDGKTFKELESMPVRAIITNVANGTKFPPGTQTMALRGAAWAGDNTIKQVDVSIDYGATWQPAEVAAPKNPYDWQRWTASVKMPSDGYYEVWARGTDSRGVMQPHVPGNWNPQGYGSNPMHRIAVLIG